MSSSMVLVLIILAIGAIALIGYLARLSKRAREVEKNIDYSKIRRWDDEDDRY